MTITQQLSPYRRFCRAWFLPVVLVGVTACGSTAQQVTTSTVDGADGLSTEVGSPAGSGGTTGSLTTSGSGATGSVPPLAGGTGGGSGGSTGGATTGLGTTGSTSGSSGAATGGASGGTGVRAGAPLKIGVVLTDVGDLSAYGFSTGQAYTEKSVDQALFDAINKRGGVSGHKLVPIFATTHTTSSNWAQDFAAACATLTQDNHVQAVLGYDFTWDQGFESCLSKAGVPHIETGYNVPDTVELNRHPLHRAVSVPTIDSRTLLKLRNGLTDGLVSTKHKLGVVLDTCPGTLDSWKRTGEPFLKSHSIAYLTYEGTCATGTNADTSAQINGVNSVIIKMRQAGVDTLTFLAAAEGPALAVVAAAADSQGWHPNYLVSSLGGMSALEGHVPNDQLAKVYGYGWLPSQDVGSARQPAKWAGQKQCLSDLASAGVNAKQFGDLTAAYRICTAVYAYGAALTKTSGNANGQAVISALDQLGTSLSSPDVLDGQSDLTASRANNAPARLRRVRFNDSCTCFLYTGPIVPIQ